MRVLKLCVMIYISCFLATESAYGEDALSTPNGASLPKRVLWITIDALRADHLGYMGYHRDTSPWLDQFADKCAVFKLAVAPSHATQESTQSYFTSKYFARLFSNPGNARKLPEEHLTIAEVFQQAGYQTLAWTANSNASPRTGLDQGFDRMTLVQRRQMPYTTISGLIRLIKREYIPSEQREFIYVHTMDVHAPYIPPTPFDVWYSDQAYQGSLVQGGIPQDKEGLRVFSNLKYHAQTYRVRKDDITILKDLYDGEIRYTDRYLQNLLKALHYTPNEDLVIITSDHGEQFFEHGFWEHHRRLFIEEIHVPLLIRFPGVIPFVHEGPVSLLDVFPTLCDLMDLASPDDLDGMSLLPLFEGRISPRAAAVSATRDNRGPIATIVTREYLYALNLGINKYIYPWRLWPFDEWLFDLRQDPDCMDDVLADNSEVADQMNKALRDLYPRFKNAKRPLLRGRASDILLGEDLFTLQDSLELPVSARTNDFGRVIELSNVKLKKEAAYLLKLRYRLSQGRGKLVARTGEPPKTVWRYRFEYVDEEESRLHVMIFPDATNLFFSLYMDPNAHFQLADMELREATLPTVQLERLAEFSPALESTESEEHDLQLTPEQKKRLENLGYL
jgi:arylsulfatase A-like enzyme